MLTWLTFVCSATICFITLYKCYRETVQCLRMSFWRIATVYSNCPPFRHPANSKYVCTSLKCRHFNLVLLPVVQAVCFVDKIECEVKRVEIARGVRLCKSSAEPFLFKVPRVKVSLKTRREHLSDYSFVLFQMDYFQDDIYPETRVKWEAAMTAEEWFAGKNYTQNFISLQPEGMKLCKCVVCLTLFYCENVHMYMLCQYHRKHILLLL